MQHCDPEVLSLAAVSANVLTSDDQRHLRTCPQCTAELAELRTVVTTVRSAPQLEVVPPPADLWGRIAAEVASGESPTNRRADPPPPPNAVTELRPQRARRAWSPRWMPLAAAALFGVFVGGAATLTVVAGQQPPAPIADAEPAVALSTAALEPLPAGGRDTRGTGSVDVEKVGDSRVLGVSTAGLEYTDGYYEVWLIDPATMDMISLGSIESGDQVVVLPIPAKVDLDKYSLVDISDEPVDGDPTHSKVSVLRGQLSV